MTKLQKIIIQWQEKKKINIQISREIPKLKNYGQEDKYTKFSYTPFFSLKNKLHYKFFDQSIIKFGSQSLTPYS